MKFQYDKAGHEERKPFLAKTRVLVSGRWNLEVFHNFSYPVKEWHENTFKSPLISIVGFSYKLYKKEIHSSDLRPSIIQQRTVLVIRGPVKRYRDNDAPDTGCDSSFGCLNRLLARSVANRGDLTGKDLPKCGHYCFLAQGIRGTLLIHAIDELASKWGFFCIHLCERFTLYD